ncbi:thioredoxin domain-containing protein [Natrinema sp. CBA1119]|uniref:DsbA family protein n=1 Tax=Natrinema sp. CBA1119 TaxID=1608465 RepID=UPI001C3F319C|nr:thioredoxin domain-containing protein [Natrinema sp. CBA1119]
MLFKHWLTAHPDDLRRVDRKQADSAVDSITFSDRLSSQGVGAAVAGLPRRYFLLAGATSIAGGIASASAYLNSQSNGEVDNKVNSVDEYKYATIGAEDAGTTITYYGSYKCPFCAQFSTGMLKELIRDYVEPSDLAIVYRNLSYFNGQAFLGADAPNAGHAGLAVYNNEPESYLDYHDYVFENQPPESQQWATANRLTEFAREAGMSDSSIVQTAVQENRYRGALRETESAAMEAGIRGTPALIIDGEIATPGQDPVRELIENAISNP